MCEVVHATSHILHFERPHTFHGRMLIFLLYHRGCSHAIHCIVRRASSLSHALGFLCFYSAVLETTSFISSRGDARIVRSQQLNISD